MLEIDTVSNVYRDVCILVSSTSRYFNRYDKSFVTIRITKTFSLAKRELWKMLFN